MPEKATGLVQACYDREAGLLAALDAGEPVDVIYDRRGRCPNTVTA